MNKIDDHLENVEQSKREVLNRVRQIIKQITPQAEEVITYGMPGFKLNGKYLIAYEAFKDHMSIFPGSDPIESLSEKLKPFKTSKGTIQFTVENPLPEDLLIEIVKSCVHRNNS